MAHGIFVTLNLLIYLAIAISAFMWSHFLLNRNTSNATELDPRLEFVPRRQPFWSAADFLVMFGTFLLAGGGVQMWFASQGWLPQPESPGQMPGDGLTAPVADQAMPIADEAMSAETLYPSLAASVLAGLIAFAVALTFVLLARRDKQIAIAELGFSGNAATVRQGLWGSLWFLPPVLLISLLVSWLVPYEHPVLDTLAAVAAEPKLIGILALFLGTAVFTPLVEEFMFRVLLQGGLQGMIDRPDPEATGQDSWYATSWSPIVITSALFAMMHIGQGAAPIPLFFLALGLGYLYRQTGSIVPPLIVHMVLNSMTLVVEFTRLLVT